MVEVLPPQALYQNKCIMNAWFLKALLLIVSQEVCKVEYLDIFLGDKASSWVSLNPSLYVLSLTLDFFISSGFNIELTT